MYKVLFSILVDPLGLPISAIYEYLILLVIGEIAYRIAYWKVGDLIDEGFLPDKNLAKMAHWVIRFVVYLLIWLVARFIIWLITIVA